MSKSTIEWTAGDDGSLGETWNPTRGCEKVSPGCKHCYAETFAERWRGVARHPYEQGFDPRMVPTKLAEPLSWKKPRRVFVNSMSDLFFEGFSDEYIAAVFGVMAACPTHTFIVLTKRAERMRAWFASLQTDDDGWGVAPHGHRLLTLFSEAAAVLRANEDDHERAYDMLAARAPNEWPLPNVWLGVSVEDQQRADERIPLLLETPAAARFVSAEPLLGPVSLGHGPGFGFFVDGGPRVDWVIAGGESGPGARPCDVGWIRSIVGQCRAAGVPAFVKQMGANVECIDVIDAADHFPGSVRLGPGTLATHARVFLRDRKGGDLNEWPEDLRVREFPR